MARILVADDDQALAEMVAENLRAKDHAVELAFDGAVAEEFAKTQIFDLLILDWNMPSRTGIEVCSTLRSCGKAAPVLFLTAKSDITDKEEGLYAGADDYLTKPFDMRELMARVTVLLRRPTVYTGKKLSLGELIVDLDSRSISRADKVVKLQPREFALLEFFVRRPGQVMGAEALLTGVWGADFDGTEIALRSCLAKLRKALSQLGYDSAIETVHGFGYKFFIGTP
jgi:DNA-binding response OmpR family regulator